MHIRNGASLGSGSRGDLADRAGGSIGRDCQRLADSQLVAVDAWVGHGELLLVALKLDDDFLTVITLLNLVNGLNSSRCGGSDAASDSTIRGRSSRGATLVRNVQSLADQQLVPVDVGIGLLKIVEAAAKLRRDVLCIITSLAGILRHRSRGSG